MKEPKDSLQPETIDQVIEGSEPTQPDRQTAHLIQQLQTGSQKYMQENERSLDRIWHRLAQSQEHPISLPPQWKRAEETQIPTIKEGNVMQNNNARVMNAPTYIPQPQKRHTSLRIIGISLIAAVAIITIVSFTLFSNLLRPVTPTAGKEALNITSVPLQLTGSSKAKLVCSFGGTNHTPQPSKNAVLSWSPQGQIVMANKTLLQAFSARNCDPTFTRQMTQPIMARWSPNGKMLMVTNDLSINILDRNGNSIANYSFKKLGILYAALVTWSSDNTKLIFLAVELNVRDTIRSIDIRSGNVKTLLTPSFESGLSQLSPDGNLLVQERVYKTVGNLAIWHVDSGKKQIFTIPYVGAGFSWVLSPDDSMLAVGGHQQIQIYSTVSGELLGTLEDHDISSKQGLSALAWSSDSKYLAEGSTAIHIYDIGAQKMLTIFGKVGSQDYIEWLAWAPDNHGLVSRNADIQAPNPIRVWTFE